MKSFAQFLVEKAPPSKAIERWIKKMKDDPDLKKQYPKEYERLGVIYGMAWKMYKAGETPDV